MVRKGSDGKMMKIVLLYVFTLCVTVYGAGEVLILHAPDSLDFEGEEPLDQSLLKEVCASSLGFTTLKGSSWGGLFVRNPFQYPEALVAVVVDGVSSLDSNKGHRFPLRTNEDEMETWEALRSLVEERFPDQSNTLMRIDLAEDQDVMRQYENEISDMEEEMPGKPVLQYLDVNETEDAEFVKELTLLNVIAYKIRYGNVKRDGMPDVYWFVVSGLHALVDLHGDSKAVDEAKDLINKAIVDISNAFTHAYDGQVVVMAMATDASHTRITRSVGDETPDAPEPDLNLSKQYSADYPVIFNIFLWFGVAFVFSIIAVAVFIADMDPGRDSIIYRMTSNRMKKDN